MKLSQLSALELSIDETTKHTLMLTDLDTSTSVFCTWASFSYINPLASVFTGGILVVQVPCLTLESCAIPFDTPPWQPNGSHYTSPPHLSTSSLFIDSSLVLTSDFSSSSWPFSLTAWVSYTYKAHAQTDSSISVASTWWKPCLYFCLELLPCSGYPDFHVL